MMKDKIFKAFLFCSAVLIVIVSGAVFYSLMSDALPAFKEYGFFEFIFSQDWGVVDGEERYGALPFITGTLLTSLLALLLCIPFSLPVALFIGEYFENTRFSNILGSIVDLLAGIPSIVYGLWGFYVIRPLMVSLGLSEQGFGVLTAAIVLAIMIIPYAASLSAEFIRLVPKELKEGAYSMGATRAEIVRHIILPSTASGIISSYILALGRALGETMAVTMLIGNTNNLTLHLSDTGNTMASIIANQFGEADGTKLSALIAIGLLLFLITACINFMGRLIIKRNAL